MVAARHADPLAFITVKNDILTLRQPLRTHSLARLGTSSLSPKLGAICSICAALCASIALCRWFLL